MDGSSINLAPGVSIDASALTFHFARSGGPGGQNVNKVNTKSELRLRPEAIRGLPERALARLRVAAANRITTDGELLIVSETARTQEGNRRECMERLAALVTAALYEPKPRRKTRPTKGSQQRRLEQKRAHSRIKQERRGGFE